jgi:uncharacterized protein (TIGR03118 family)
MWGATVAWGIALAQDENGNGGGQGQQQAGNGNGGGQGQQGQAGNGSGGGQGQQGQQQAGNGSGAVYLRTDLVSDLQNLAQPADPNLQNAWGVANAPGGPLWVSDNNDGLSTLYDGNGVKTNLTITIPLPAAQAATPAAAQSATPAAAQSATPATATPTGMVWNPTTAFTISAGGTTAPSTFIFDTEDGTISAWNPTVDPVANGQSTATLVVDNSASGAVYKGLAFGTNTHGNFLFATNFSAGTVEVYDQTFKPATLDGNFSDPNIPAGFAPFGITNIDNNLFVTYAMQNPQKDDEITGPGLGFVDVFSTDGVLIKRFASGGTLNAPWGVSRATQNFGQFSGDILIGNFGQGQFGGQINAFDSANDNRFLGALQGADGQPISIDGLWAIVFGTFSHSDADTLYFTAGPNQQQDGLFGKIAAQPSSNSAMAQPSSNSAMAQPSSNSATAQPSSNSATGQSSSNSATGQSSSNSATAQPSPNSVLNAQ